MVASAQPYGSADPVLQETWHPATTEKVFVRTDRDMYVSGEEVFYAVTLIPNGHDEEDPSVLAYLLLQNEGGEMLEGIAVQLTGNAGNGSMYLPDTLSTGFYRLLAYTNEMRNFSPDNFFSKTLFVANRFDRHLEMLMDMEEETDRADVGTEGMDAALARMDSDLVPLNLITGKEAYGRREEVRFSIEMPMAAGENLRSLSVAVVPDHSLWPFLKSHEQMPQAPAEATAAVISYPRETSGPVISGLVKKTNGELQHDRYRILLSTPDSLTALQYTSTGNSGVFYISPGDYFLGRPLYLTIDTTNDIGSLAIVVEDKYDVGTPFRGYRGPIPQGLPSGVRESQDVVTVQKAYELMQPQDIIQEKQEPRFPPRLYSQPLRTVVPANFVALDDFREIARELIPTLRIRSQRNEWQIRLLNNQTAYTFFDRQPAIFINNLPLGNPEKLMMLSSHDIRHIDVHNLPWRYGHMQFDGILSVFTHDAPEASDILPTPFAEIPPLIIQQPTAHEAPNHNKQHAETGRTPDFRQLLFWCPEIQLNDEGVYEASFFTGDLGGKYVIFVQGYTDDGELVEYSTSFEVQLD